MNGPPARVRNGIGIGSVVSLVLFAVSSIPTAIMERAGNWPAQDRGLETAASLFFNAHLIGVGYRVEMANVFFRSRYYTRGDPFPREVWLALPVLLLCLGGVAAVIRSETDLTAPGAFVTGSLIAAGYVPFVALGTLLVDIDWPLALLVAGVAYPVACGGTAGVLWYALGRGLAAAAQVPWVRAVIGNVDAAAESTAERVEMTDRLVFRPEAITITAGETVTWENAGSVTHTVTAYGETLPDEAEYFASGGFDSEDLAREAYPDGGIEGGDSYSHTFETPGTYGYFCVPQEDVGMTGTVEVRPEQSGDGESA